MLNQSYVDHFERDGYVHIPQVLPQDLVDRLVAAGDKWVASDHQDMRQQAGNGTDGFRNCISLDEAFLELIAYPAMLPYLVTMLGPDIKLLTSHLIYRSPAAKDTPRLKRVPGWHRDFAKAQRSLGHARMPRLDIKVAYCLSDLPTSNCGGTLFVPGSHTLKEKLDFEPGTDPEGAVEPTVRAGDCVIFENRTWHAGSANLSDATRKVVMMGYTYTWIESADYENQPLEIVEKAEKMYGEIGLQMLSALPRPQHFDFNYDTKPLKAYAEANNLEANAQMV